MYFFYSHADHIGLVGVIVTLIAYFFVQAEIKKPDEPMVPTFNLFGSILVLWSLYVHPNISSIIIESCWVLISVYSLLRIRNKHKVAAQR